MNCCVVELGQSTLDTYQEILQRMTLFQTGLIFVKIQSTTVLKLLLYTFQTVKTFLCAAVPSKSVVNLAKKTCIIL